MTAAVRVPDLGTWLGATGLASLESGDEMTIDSRLRIGSITKTFVAAVMLQLEVEGALALDDSVDRWVPELELDDDITIEMLLNHTSGIFNFTDDSDFLGLSRVDTAPEEVIEWALGHGAVHSPGASWSYSNTGFFVAGLVLEAAEGAPLHEILRARLFEPLGLEDTFLQDFEEIPGGIVEGYVGGVLSTDLIHMSWAWAAGGLVSTSDDLCRWAAALFGGDVLPSGVVERMVMPVESSLVAGEDYGLGIQRLLRQGLYVAGHTGSTMGFRDELFYDLDSGVCVSVQANDFLAVPRRAANPLWERVTEALP